jgi:hypothetical protein
MKNLISILVLSLGVVISATGCQTLNDENRPKTVPSTAKMKTCVTDNHYQNMGVYEYYCRKKVKCSNSNYEPDFYDDYNQLLLVGSMCTEDNVLHVPYGSKHTRFTEIHTLPRIRYNCDFDALNTNNFALPSFIRKSGRLKTGKKYVIGSLGVFPKKKIPVTVFYKCVPVSKK